MQPEQTLRFGPYRLDLGTGQLWRGTLAVKLTPKAAAVLRLLVMQPGQLREKAELFQTVWPDTVVGDGALTSCIQELRRVLHDDARKPRYIETVHRRGFRFIGKVASSQYSVASRRTAGSGSQLTTDNWPLTTPPPQLTTGYWQLTTPLVGRDTELAQLHVWLDKALSGARQIVFISGEPGIGKTTLVEAFLMGIRGWGLGVGSASLPTTILTPPVSALIPIPNPQSPTPNPWIGRGQCIEHYGAGEAYLPILEALGRLGRAPDGNRVIEILSQHAPTWLVQMPALLGVTELEALQRKTQGATRERMLRELAGAVEALTVDRLLILWLEDLHWADVSTLDWLAYVARRQELARLLVIGTYRPVEVLTRAHPLKDIEQELRLHGQCEELALDFLSEEDVAEYLVQRFGTPSPVSTGEGQGEGLFKASLCKLAQLIHRRTDGNPLFMVNVVNDLIARGILGQSEGRWELQGNIEESIGKVPESLQQLIEQQIARLRPETQRLLEVASVAGAESSAAAVAAGLETEIDVIEEQCEALARQEHFLRASGTAEWPDGTVATRYGFLHALYQDVLYDRLTARRRQRLHRQIGEREEQGYGKQAREIAAELALHFERGREYHKAIQYLQYAGENASRRSANQEAINLLTKGLELLKTLPDTPERARQELRLQLALGTPLIATKGYAAPEVGNTYARARELCQQVGETPRLFQVLNGLCAFHVNRAEFQTARELGEQLLTLARRMQNLALLEVAHNSLGFVLSRLGELILAREHLEQSIAFYDSRKHRLQASPYAAQYEVFSLSCLAWDLWVLGHPGQAHKRSYEAVALAQELAHPFNLAYALGMAARFHQLRRERQAVKEQAEAVIELSTEHGFPYWLALGTILQGWALAEQGQEEEGIAQIRQGLATYRATGAEAGRPSNLALLAEAYGKAGQAEEGLAVLAEALATVNKTGERWYEAELYRLRGELTLAQSSVQRLASSV